MEFVRKQEKTHPFRIGLRLQDYTHSSTIRLVQCIILSAERLPFLEGTSLIPVGRSPDSRLPMQLAFPSSQPHSNPCLLRWIAVILRTTVAFMSLIPVYSGGTVPELHRLPF